jgi:L-lactate dehydrogenase (cytochrome)
MAGGKQVSISEIAKHNTETDCWIVVDGIVYDITDFAPNHPGGPGIIYKYAGHDGTKAYTEIHAASIIKEGLAEDKVKGTLDTSTITDEWAKPPQSEKPKRDRDDSEKPPLESLINANDFEYAAKATATAKTWAFYSSADTSLVTRDANASLYSKIWFRPRVMRNVAKVSIATTILGHKVDAPIMISPAAMAKFIHPDGELAMGRAAAAKKIIQSISINASYAVDDIVGQQGTKDHPFFFQLYVDRKRANSERLLQKIHSSGNITAIMVTTDAAAPGKREADERIRADEGLSNPMHTNQAKNDKKGGGYS